MIFLLIFYSLRLSKDDFEKLIEHNPSLLRALEAIALERYELLRSVEQSFERRQSYTREPKEGSQSYDWVSNQLI